LFKFTGVVVSIVFVYLAVRKVDLSEFLRALETVRPGWLIAATLVYLSSFPIRALRWRGILRDQKPLSLGQIMTPVMVGYMANNVLPARTGEVYRAHFLGRRTQMSRSGAAGSIVVERTFDGLMLICIILLVLVLFPQTRFLGGAVLVMGIVFFALATSIMLYGFAVDHTQRIIDKGMEVLPRRIGAFAGYRIEAFLRGIRGISTVGGYLEAAAYTMLIWTLDASAITLVVISFNVILSPSGYLLVFALASFSSMLPSGPGYIGPLQYAFVVALGVFAVSQETALAVSIVVQLALLGPVTVIGLALLLLEQLRVGPRLGKEGLD
jgi:uncharacterized protein (TIRG00374 family)